MISVRTISKMQLISFKERSVLIVIFDYKFSISIKVNSLCPFRCDFQTIFILIINVMFYHKSNSPSKDLGRLLEYVPFSNQMH